MTKMVIVMTMMTLAAAPAAAAGGDGSGASDIDAATALTRAWAERAFCPRPPEPAAPAPSRLTIVHEDAAGDTKVGLCAFGTPMRLGERTYTRGIGVNSRSVIRVALDRPGSRFLAHIGLDRNVDGTAASVAMHVAINGRDVFATPVIRPIGEVRSIDVPLAGARAFDLIVDDGGDGRGWDQADWADARVILEDGTSLWLDDLARGADVEAGLPFSFVYDGAPSTTFLAGWERDFREEEAGDGRRILTLILTDPRTRLEVRAACTIYTDSPGADWILHFTNKGERDAPLLEDVRAVDLGVRIGPGASPMLRRLEGSTCAADDWMPIEEPLPAGARILFGAINGRSSAEGPFFALDWGAGGVITAVGWSGQWRGSVERGTGGEVRIRAGMERLRVRLRPGETIRSPRILQIRFAGSDPRRAHNLFRRTMLRHIVPRIDGRPVMPPIAHLSTSFYELNASTEANVLSHLEAIRGLGFEMFWLDAYWTRGGFPAGMGNYGLPIESVEPRDRFPRGLAAIGEAVRKEGLEFLMWFEPERVHPGTRIAGEHPEWVISPAGDGSGLFDLGNPEARAYMTRYLDAAVEAYGLDWLRIDYNIDPLPFWAFLDAKDPDRTGMGEIRYIEGLYRMWDDILAAHPRLSIDNCASGGRRIDLETCARSIPLWRSDNTCDMVDLQDRTILAAAIKNQVMSGGLNRYIPASLVGQMGTTPYLFRSGFNGGIAFAQDCRPAGFPRDRLREAIAEAKRLRRYWGGEFYPLSEPTLDPAAWCVLQYHLPDEDAGAIVAFRRHRSPYASFDCAVEGIDPGAEYAVSEAQSFRPGEPVRMKGEVLRRYRVVIDDMPGSTCLEYRRIEAP
ncbi:MAG: alpha-galactosidase [Planctomycetes bacterium]|nr:alpha-galactosidase [Planctomycetota bacterium]